MSDNIEQAVKAKYGAAAVSGLSSEHAGVRAVAEAFGYTPEELAATPAEANLGLPTGFAYSLMVGRVRIIQHARHRRKHSTSNVSVLFYK